MKLVDTNLSDYGALELALNNTDEETPNCGEHVEIVENKKSPLPDRSAELSFFRLSPPAICSRVLLFIRSALC